MIERDSLWKGSSCHYFYFCINMDLLIYILLDTVLVIWCILHVAYVYIKTKKLIYAIWYYCN
jgi:hypothetical protein